MGSTVASELTAAESTDASDRKAWLIVAYIMAGCTALLILLTLLMVRRVKVGTHFRPSVLSAGRRMKLPVTLDCKY